MPILVAQQTKSQRLPPLLEFNDVNTYYGELHVLKGVNYRVGDGEIVCLLGGNASGKSTTMKTILGIVKPKSGTVVYGGSTINDLATASETVVRGVTRGLLTPGEGQAFTVMLDGRRRMIETQELEVRLRALEEGRNKL